MKLRVDIFFEFVFPIHDSGIPKFEILREASGDQSAVSYQGFGVKPVKLNFLKFDLRHN